MEIIRIKVSKETKELVEALMWVTEKLPKNCVTGSSKKEFRIDNLEKDKTLIIEIE
jgi:hypothetical protein